MQRYHDLCLKEMKAKLPKRESERRIHPLAMNIDALNGMMHVHYSCGHIYYLIVFFFLVIETRLSLLYMTYSKYVVLGCFCFIPGKVSL